MADVRGARLLADLNNAFKKDPDIDEYDIIPVIEPTHNRSPFILQDHKLGVESWAVKILMKYSALRLNRWRGHTPEEQLTDSEEVCCLTRAVLLFSPEVYTAWNIRKELIEHGYLSLCGDFAFGALVLSKHPNSSETYVHRRWLFRYFLDNSVSSNLAGTSFCSSTLAATNDSILNVEAIDVDMSASLESGVCENGNLELVSFRSYAENELKVCHVAAERYACNYHAWSHRIWVLQHCLNCSLEAVMSEFKVTQAWTSQHISDHSGFHYREFLLSQLHNRQRELSNRQSQVACSQNCTEILLQEMSLLCDLIHSYPGHETLWYYRRFLFWTLLKSQHLKIRLENKLTNGHVSAGEQTQPKDLEALRSFCISQELESVTGKETSDSSCFQQILLNKYIRWLQTL